MRRCGEKRAVFVCALTSHQIPHDKRVLSCWPKRGSSLSSRAMSEVGAGLQRVVRGAEFLQSPPSGVFSAPVWLEPSTSTASLVDAGHKRRDANHNSA